MRERNPPEPLDFNELVSLPLDKQSTSILKWLTDCESFLSDSTAEEASQHQQAFQSAFLNLLGLPTPPLTHVLRDCLGRCFSHIFEKGDRRVLFETVSALLQKVNQFRVDKEAKQKQYDPF
jgi:HEAT repeat-containing protein 5